MRVTFVPGLEAVPGMAELIPNEQIDAQAWYGVVSPANMPAAVLARVHAAITEVVRRPDFGDRLTPLGFQAVTDATPAAFLEFWRAEETKWRQLVEISGATAE